MKDFFIQEFRISFTFAISILNIKIIDISNGNFSDLYYTSELFAVLLRVDRSEILNIKNIFIEFTRWRCHHIFELPSDGLGTLENVIVNQNGGAALPCIFCIVTSASSFLFKNLTLRNLVGYIDDPSMFSKNGIINILGSKEEHLLISNQQQLSI